MSFFSFKIIGHSMGAGIAAILTYMLREDNKLSSSSCIAFGPAACMTWDLAESGKHFVTSVVNKNDMVPSFGKASAANLRTEVVASSWAPDLQEQIQQTRILGFVSNTGSDNTPMDELNLSANVRAAVQKHSSLSCWSSVAVNTQFLEALVNPTQGIPALMPAYRGTEQNTEKPTIAREPASCFPGELNRQKSDSVETDPEEKATDQEHMDQLLRALRSSRMVSQEPHQLYPPGRIMHMVELPAPEGLSTGEQCHQHEVVAIYETPRSMYGKIRLARTMIRDHYMPRYIETMEMLIDKLAEDEDDTDNRLD